MNVTELDELKRWLEKLETKQIAEELSEDESLILGDLYWTLHEDEKTRETFEIASTKYPDNLIANILLVDCLLMLPNSDDYYDQIKVSSNAIIRSGGEYAGLGYHFLSLADESMLPAGERDLQKKIEKLEKAISISPSLPLLHFSLAKAYDASGNLTKAIFHSDQSLKGHIEPDQNWPRYMHFIEGVITGRCPNESGLKELKKFNKRIREHSSGWNEPEK